MSATGQTQELTEKFLQFYRDYYRDDIGQLAQRYPNDQRSLEISYDELYRFDTDMADDYLADPDQLQEYAEEALRLFDLPADVKLGEAHVRLCELSDEDTYYPGHFSPSKIHNERPYLAVRGEVVASSDVYPKITEAAFECQRCGNMAYIPQTDGKFQEPHECAGCERQGPFKVNFDQSEFIDAQKIRVSEPPEVASGDGQTIDIYLADDMAGLIETGNRVTINGILQLEQRKSGKEKKAAFDPYIDGIGVEIEESDETDIDITPEEREEIRRLAAGAEGKPIDVAAQGLAPKIYGYQHIKRALILAIVEGAWVQHPDGSVDRGSINVLLAGDPGTAKSKLIDAAKDRAPRAVGVSGKGARTAGITASAVRDDFSDGEWTLKAGAFVKANGGLVRIDELDDMPKEVRSAMLEPMANGQINVNKAGINATLQTRVGVVAACNPEYGRFDQYEPLPQQVDISPTLISRFDLVYTVTDNPDREGDMAITNNITSKREYAKRVNATDIDVTDEEIEEHAPIISGEMLTKWLALAKRQPDPVLADPSLGDQIDKNFVDFRNDNNEEGKPIPATFRKHEAILQVAEAVAKLELSRTIETRHVTQAVNAVIRSMEDYAKDENGDFSADVAETGSSMSQSKRRKNVLELINELAANTNDGADIDEVLEEGSSRFDVDKDMISGDIEHFRKKGKVYEPRTGKTLRVSS